MAEEQIAVAVAGAEPWGLDGSIIMYGIIADVCLLVPMILYLVLDDSTKYHADHQTYINMIYSAYMPIGIMWWILLADDSNWARTLFQGAIELAGLGPIALLWVGFSTFLMEAHENEHLGQSYSWMWGIIYPCINILLIAMHHHLAPPMHAWTRLAPLPVNPIDSVKPWAQPEGFIPAPETPAAEEVIDPIVVEDEPEIDDVGDEFADEEPEPISDFD